MSFEQTKAFIEKMKSDEAFRNKVMAVEDVEERIVMIKNEGFDCSAEEFRQLQAELKDIEQGKARCGIFCAPRNL